MGRNSKSEKSLLCEKGERTVQCLQWDDVIHVPPVRGRLIVHCPPTTTLHERVSPLPNGMTGVIHASRPYTPSVTDGSLKLQHHLLHQRRVFGEQPYALPCGTADGLVVLGDVP